MGRRDDASAATITREISIALVGAPNAGKTSVFNALTGMNSRTGNYPGVTVSRSTGTFRWGDHSFSIEDLPGTYSLEPISPDEEIVVSALEGNSGRQPDAVLVVVDATTLQRSLALVAQVLRRGLPTGVVVTMGDELQRRQGRLDVDKLARALGIPVTSVIANRTAGLDPLRELCAGWAAWSIPPVEPPTDRSQLRAWARSVLTASDYQPPAADSRTSRIDAVVLHPVWGTATFVGVMFLFFQIIFSFSAPVQDAMVTACQWVGQLVRNSVGIPWLSGLLADGVVGGVGSVIGFLPQILLLFLMLSVLEDIGYLSRAAFLMDRLMAKAGLEGRAFVSLLSSFACAVPGIMATRTLPSAKDRIATMLAAPLMTCSARLPVYVLMISMLIDPDARLGPFQIQGLTMFCLYFLGAVIAMVAAWVVSVVQRRRRNLLPFFMEMPSYRVPTLRATALSTWGAAKTFLRKCGTIIMAASIVMWILLNVSVPGTVGDNAHPSGRTSGFSTAARMEHSVAAAVGRSIEPVFAPLGFDWRINVGIVASLTARETFVSTLGQMSSADDPDDPRSSLARLTYTEGPHLGERVFTSPTIAALLVFFMFALQCMSTVAVLRRESGGWKWPAVAFAYMFALAWSGAWLAHLVVDSLIGRA